MGNDRPSRQVFPVDVRGNFWKRWMGHLSKDAKILDCGCGYGHQLYALKLLGFSRLYGIEIVESSYRIAKEELGDSATIVMADAFEFLRNNVEVFDVIILNDVLEHVPREKTLELLHLIRGALKTGGVVHVRVPNMSSILASYSMYLDFTHLVGFTEFSLMQVFELAGFDSPQIHSSFPKATWRPRHPIKMIKRFALQIVCLGNIVLHRFLYALRRQQPIPKEIGYNLEVFAYKN